MQLIAKGINGDKQGAERAELYRILPYVAISDNIAIAHQRRFSLSIFPGWDTNQPKTCRGASFIFIKLIFLLNRALRALRSMKS